MKNCKDRLKTDIVIFFIMVIFLSSLHIYYLFTYEYSLPIFITYLVVMVGLTLIFLSLSGGANKVCGLEKMEKK